MILMLTTVNYIIFLILIMYIYKKFNFMALNPLVLAAAIPAVGSVFSNLLGFKSQQNTNEQNIQLAKYQNSWNEMMWRKNNQYNSPVAQMDRLKKAGLNPNLVYGNGSTTVVGNSSSPASGVAAPKLQAYTNFSNPFASSVETYSNLSLKKSQENLMKSQASAADASASLSLATAAAKIFDTDIKKETKETLVNSIIQDYNNKVKTGSVLDANVEKLLKEANHLQIEDEYLMQKISSDEAYKKLLEEQVLTERSKQVLNSSSARAAISAAILSDARARGQNIQNDLDENTFLYKVAKVMNEAGSSESEFNIKRLEQKYYEQFGYRPGYDLIKSIIGLHLNSLLK